MRSSAPPSNATRLDVRLSLGLVQLRRADDAADFFAEKQPRWPPGRRFSTR